MTGMLIMTLNDLPALCTVRQTARHLFGDESQTARNRIYTWIDNGDIHAKKVGSRYYIHRRAIEEYVNPAATSDE